MLFFFAELRLFCWMAVYYPLLFFKPFPCLEKRNSLILSILLTRLMTLRTIFSSCFTYVFEIMYLSGVFPCFFFLFLLNNLLSHQCWYFVEIHLSLLSFTLYSIFVACVLSARERDEGEKGFVEMTLKFIVWYFWPIFLK